MTRSLMKAAIGCVALFATACGDDNGISGNGQPAGDASAIDAAVSDAAVSDAARSDAAVPDASPDAAIPDAAVPDAAIPDAAVPDAAVPDAAVPDASPDAGVMDEPSYAFLSETGLYDDIDAKLIADENIEFEPEFRLWADGAEKRRWIFIPPGQRINTANMDHWRFPPGTKIWKEFSHVVGGNTVLLETRLTEIWGPATNQIYQATFVWNVDDSDAPFARFGATNIKGTNHDAPAADQCVRCHRGETSKVLGFQAVQLSHDAPMNIDDFAAMDVLSDLPAAGGYPVPGNAVERAAVGYMHANCGHCHNNSNPQVAANACFDLPQLQLWVKTTDEMIFDTYAYLQTVDQPLQYWISPNEGNFDGYTHRIIRGDPAASAISYRMGFREAGQTPPLDDAQQMPPIFTDLADATGLAAIEAWIESL